MQNRYVGDIGDYVKLGILRALSPGYRFGVAWWLYPDESHNQEHRHIGYLQNPDQWWKFDPQLFDAKDATTDKHRCRLNPAMAATAAAADRGVPGTWPEPPG
jgi:hypothetical protein